MILTPIKNQTQEEFIQKVFTIREGMITNNYHFILGKDTLSAGEVNVDTRRLTAKINNVSYDLAYNLTDTGLNLSSPIILSVGLVLVGCSKSDDEVQMTKADFNIVSAENSLPVSGGANTSDDRPCTSSGLC